MTGFVLLEQNSALQDERLVAHVKSSVISLGVSYWVILTRVFQRDGQFLIQHLLFENPEVDG